MKLNDKVYDVLKYIAIIGLPAIATFYAVIAPVWGLPYGEEIPKTISAVQTCLGALLMVSTANYNKSLKTE